MIVDIECMYCGHKWEQSVYNQYSLNDMKCKTCNDKNLKYKDREKSTIDYYQGSPPFPEKKKEEEYDPYTWMRRSD